ncbi:ATP-binding cassette domain-containing protein [Gammaproteobacteria bacterium]|nr:ATP-binding cassette domain-containing protein [Gammaproteobacteria bacterium]
MDTSLSFKDVSFAYKKKIILHDINIKLSKKGISVIYGENGAGKTTLLRLMSGILQSNKGNIYYCNDFKPSFIFQKPILLRRTVEDNLLHILMINNNMSKSDALWQVRDILSKYNLADISKEYAFKLSGGQQQMVSILRSLIVKPNILFCDEPTSNLDNKNRLLVEEILREKSKMNKIILVTQDETQSRKMADEVYHLEDMKLKIK